MDDYLSDSIEQLDLSVRSYNYCRRYGIMTIQQLSLLPPSILFQDVALGSKKVYDEIQENLNHFFQEVNRSKVY